jgi:prepilin-type processing-associated H-X9-DG protein
MGTRIGVNGIDLEACIALVLFAALVVWFGVCLVRTFLVPWRRARRMWFVWLGVVGLVVGVLLVLPASGIPREGLRRAQCKKNLRQIGLAMEDYCRQYGCYPPAYTVDKDGNRLHSWRVLLLPFLERRDLYDRLRLDEPWNSPHNLALAEGVLCYHCPSDRDSSKLDTSYVMVVGPRTISNGPTSTSLKDITDGTGNTILIVEMSDSGIHWMEPRDLKFDEISFKINDPDGTGIRSKHPGGANVAFCDSSTYWIKDNVDPELLRGLLTRNGGEDVSEFFNRPNPPR